MAKVLIAEQSHIISSGFLDLLKGFKDIEDVKVVTLAGDCVQVVKEYLPDLILINTSFLSENQMSELMLEKGKEVQLLNVFNSLLPIDAPSNQLSILDAKSALVDKITSVLTKVEKAQNNDNEELSPREKAILKQVALGLTNKEIAEKTYISTHTVISHRKNITRKLGIKTVSGLTVYAILNNIIQMDDIS